MTLFGLAFTLSCTVTSLVGAATTERIILDYRTGLAIHGYDPVAYFTDAVALAGRDALELRYEGVVWRFRNAGNRAAFAERPDVYMPQFGGYDPVGVTQLFMFHSVETARPSPALQAPGRPPRAPGEGRRGSLGQALSRNAVSWSRWPDQCVSRLSPCLDFRRASVYRPGHWADDDYDVYDGERIVGRIFRAEARHRAGTPWMWTLVFHERRPPGPHQGFAVSREEAMVAFKASWERGRS